ncbi:MAG: threonine synthase [Treponema sp.]|nr:threonine synthase [Treponema sp.]MCL2271486.1 threonine synthase [Treponema sp.]
MQYISTRNKNETASFAEAALEGLAPDGGLFIPQEIPRYSAAVRSSLGAMDFTDIAFETIRPYVSGVMDNTALADIINSSFTFNAPLIAAADRYAVELFHGPTAAFKDFGARFMARSFSHLRRGEDRSLHILVATSGDTGGAVADGFFNVPGISVTVLYPKGRVTPLQERQIAGLGNNIRAVSVEGSFDDCQSLVKAALSDNGLKERMSLSSANSINISRLIPQAVYYSAAAGRAFAGKADADGEATPRVKSVENNNNVFKAGLPVTLCVPSGNFGNLTAGLYAMKMGAPITQFIAATNINKTIPEYLSSGGYLARVSQATISNAMDVGAPSNFERMAAHFSLEEMRKIILGIWVSDEETRETIVRVYDEAGYILDPHSAVGWKGVDKLKEENKTFDGNFGIFCTAHPAKFSEVVQPLVGQIPVPSSLSRAMERTVNSTSIPADTSAFFELLNAISPVI